MSRTATLNRPKPKSSDAKPAKPSRDAKAQAAFDANHQLRSTDMRKLLRGVCEAADIDSPWDAPAVAESMFRELFPPSVRRPGEVGHLDNPHALILTGRGATPPLEVLGTVRPGDVFRTDVDGEFSKPFIARYVLLEDSGAMIVAFSEQGGPLTAFGFRPAASAPSPAPVEAPKPDELPFTPPPATSVRLVETRAERAECSNEVCGAVIPATHLLTYAADDLNGKAAEILPGNQLLVAVCSHCRMAHRAERTPDRSSASGWRITRYLPSLDRGELLQAYQAAADANRRATPLTGEMPLEQDTMSHGVLDLNATPDEAADEQQRQLAETDR